jgi:hypothetical protein
MVALPAYVAWQWGSVVLREDHAEHPTPLMVGETG